MHISRIRAAIEDDPKKPRRIVTVRGSGYVFAKAQDYAAMRRLYLKIYLTIIASLRARGGGRGRRVALGRRGPARLRRSSRWRAN